MYHYYIMESYKDIQNLPNSPLTPLTPLRENRSFNFKFGGDKSLDAYVKNFLLPVKEPIEFVNECSERLKHAPNEIQFVDKKHLQNSSVLNLNSNNIPLFPTATEGTKLKQKSTNKSLSPRLAKLLRQRNLLAFKDLFELEEIDIWVFCHLERKDIIHLGIKDELYVDMIMSGVKYAKQIYGNQFKIIDF